MKTFEKYLYENFILEMPHIRLDNDTKVVDLELEVHSKLSEIEFISYIKDWIDGKPIQSKTPGFSMQVNASVVKEFAQKMLTNNFFKNYVVFNYGQNTWKKLEKMFLNKIKEVS